jgi:hypothetical protein
MDNHIQLPIEELGFELVCPEAFGAKVVQGRDLVLVSHGAHGVDCVAVGWRMSV